MVKCPNQKPNRKATKEMTSPLMAKQSKKDISDTKESGEYIQNLMDREEI